MKIRPIFESHEKLITQFANSHLGRWYLRAENLPIIKVAPDGIHYLQDIKNGRIYKKAVFKSYSPYLKKFRGAIEFIVKAGMLVPYALNPEAIWYPAFSLTTSTFNPDADPESTSCDGIVDRRSRTDSFATIRGSGDGDYASDNDNSELGAFLESNYTTGQWKTLRRCYFNFDTSSIGSGQQVDSGSMTLSWITSADDLNGGETYLTDNESSSATSLAVGDWDNGGTTKLSNVVADMSAPLSGTTAFTLNDDGKSAIAMEGITKIGTKINWDFDNSAPTHPGTKKSSWDLPYFADNGSSEPELSVTYSEAVAESSFVPKIIMY